VVARASVVALLLAVLPLGLGAARAAAVAAPPTVTALYASRGPAAGGVNVQIWGTGFTGATRVRFGAGNPTTSFVVDSDTFITAQLPPAPTTVTGTLVVNVFVDTPAGSNANQPSSWFTYAARPKILSLAPLVSSTDGSQTITMSVANLANAYSTVRVAGEFVSEDSYTYTEPATITFTTPPGSAGSAPVTIEGPGGTSDPATITYVASPRPHLQSKAPAAVPSTGGTSVTVTGSGFTGTTAVELELLGSHEYRPVASFTVASDTQLGFVTPALPEGGTYYLRVTNPYGHNPDSTVADELNVNGPPEVDSLSPTSGPTAGGVSVTITGQFLDTATSVTFGGVPATFTVVNVAQLTAVTPPHAAGVVPVVVHNAIGSSSSLDYTFAGQSPPVVTGLAPASGGVAGGTAVTITGYGFTGATSVTFGGIAATSFSVVDDDHLAAVSPPNPLWGSFEVFVTSPLGTSPSNLDTDQFTYLPAPHVVTLTPQGGPRTGGTTVHLSGDYLTGVTSVTFGGTPAASFTVFDDGDIIAVTPAHDPGAVPVVVSGPNGSSTAYAGGPPTFTYTAVGVPEITGLSPATGLTTGGELVTLSGTGLDRITGVRFGSTAVAYTIVNAWQVHVFAPPHAAGAVTVTVASAFGDSPPVALARYAYTVPPPPKVIWANIGQASAAGGTTVVYHGSHFTGTTRVRFGPIDAAHFTVNSDTQLTVVTPAVTDPAIDFVNVYITTPNGTNAPGTFFSFNFPPTITSISPAWSPTAGGATVVITGMHLQYATSVRIGGVDASWFDASSATSVTVTLPAHAAGAVPVTVETSYGTSQATAAASITYGVPLVTSTTPSRGPVAGGTVVVVHGFGFTGTTGVRFGPTTPASFTVDSDTQLTITAPAGVAPGVANIWVTSALGTSAKSMASWFTYQ
jgi:hypothetical protein